MFIQLASGFYAGANLREVGARDGLQSEAPIAVEQRVAFLTRKQVLADSGYRSEANFAQLETLKVDGVIALGREGKTVASSIAESNKATHRMKQKLASEDGAAAYRRRKVIVEPVFGWIKGVLGFRQFSLRGLSKTNAEWHLVCLAMNLRRMSGGRLATGT